MSRAAGISLLAIRWAAWPDINAPRLITTLLIYILLVTFYLGYVGFVTGLVGPMLWPAFALHALLTGLLPRSWLNSVRYELFAGKGVVVILHRRHCRLW